MMKHIKNSLIICLAFIFVLTLVSCIQVTPAVDLAIPEVTVSESGLASWAAVENAKGYKYIIDSEAEQLTTATSVQLEDGQEIKVKAVGNGSEFNDSKYSAAVKYVAPVTVGLPANKVGFYMINSDVIQEGDTRYLTYITNKTQGEQDNVVAVAKATKNAEGWVYEDQVVVLEGTVGGWDEYITSASIVKGVFSYKGQAYSYLMVYAATSKSNETCNEIGMAVANSPVEGFVKVGEEAIIKYNRAVYNDFYGCSAPSAVNYDKASGIRIFYTYADAYGAFARFYDVDCANLDAVEPVDASYTIHMTNKGNLQGGEDVLMFPNADFAYNAAEGKFVCVKDVSPAGSTNPKVATAIEVAYIAEAELYTTDVETGFVSMGAYDGFDLGTTYERVYNASLISDEYGHILDVMEVVYTVAELEVDNPDYLYTQHFLDLVIE